MSSTIDQEPKEAKRHRPPMLFFSSGSLGNWPSDDSEDSDYDPHKRSRNGRSKSTSTPSAEKSSEHASAASQNSGSLSTEKMNDTSASSPSANSAAVKNCASVEKTSAEVVKQETANAKNSSAVSAATPAAAAEGVQLNGAHGNVVTKHHRKRTKQLDNGDAKVPKKKKKKRRYRGEMVANIQEGSNSMKIVLIKKKRLKQNRKKSKSESESATSEQTPPVPPGLWDRRIPEEILVKIFKEVVRRDGAIPFLLRMSKVCPLWKRATRDRSLWEQVDLSWGIIEKSEARLINLCKEWFSPVKDINLTGWGNSLTNKGVQAVVEYCPKLTAINLSHCTKISSDSIHVLANNCPNLSSIDLSAVSSSMTGPVSSGSLKILVSKCGGQLTHLMLAENKVAWKSIIMNLISECCPNLQVLDLSNLKSTSTLVFPVERFQQGCPKLKVLRLANSMLVLSSASVATQVQSPGFPDLEELSIAVESVEQVSIGDNGLERILKTSHKLKLLDARNCRNITVSGLVRIPAWDLQDLFLANCAAARTSDLELVLRKWGHSLCVVDLCGSINEEAINQAVFALATTDNEPPIRVLDLTGSAVSLQTVTTLLNKCKHLCSLNLQSCRSLPRGMKRMYIGKEFQRFREEILEGKFKEETSVV